MGYRLNHLDEPVFITVSKPLLTEFGIHHRLESCASSIWHSAALKLYCNPKIKGIIIILIAYRFPQYCAYYPAFHEGYLPCLQTSCHLERMKQIETLSVSFHGIAFVPPHQLVELHTPLVFKNHRPCRLVDGGVCRSTAIKADFTSIMITAKC